MRLSRSLRIRDANAIGWIPDADGGTDCMRAVVVDVFRAARRVAAGRSGLLAFLFRVQPECTLLRRILNFLAGRRGTQSAWMLEQRAHAPRCRSLVAMEKSHDQQLGGQTPKRQAARRR